MQRIEGVEKFFLGVFLFRKKLNVIYEEHVDIAIFLAKIFRVAVADGINKFISEFFAGNIENF